MSDNFYIGWERQSPRAIGQKTAFVCGGLFLAVVFIAVALAVSQRLIGTAIFEWGNIKSFSGIFEAKPYPHLLVVRPGNPGEFPNYSSYELVAPWKFGLASNQVAEFDGKFVSLKGTLVYRENQTLIETTLIKAATDATNIAKLPPTISLGRQTLKGEIVDSKCFLGVMNPGELAPHRACAIRCISGGIPPLFLVRQRVGPPIYLFLVSSEGKPVNQQILDKVAQPLEITGEVERQGETLILRADPVFYRTL